jgi:hypothetical protein
MTVRKAALVAIKKQLGEGKRTAMLTEHDQADGTHSVTVGGRPLLCRHAAMIGITTRSRC